MLELIKGGLDDRGPAEYLTDEDFEKARVIAIKLVKLTSSLIESENYSQKKWMLVTLLALSMAKAKGLTIAEKYNVFSGGILELRAMLSILEQELSKDAEND